MSDIPSRSGAADENGKPRLGFKGLLKMFRRKGGGSESALRDAIEELIEESEAGDDGDAPLPTNESSLLLNVLKLGDLTAYDVMVPRADIRALPQTTDLKGLLQTVRENDPEASPALMLRWSQAMQQVVNRFSKDY